MAAHKRMHVLKYARALTNSQMRQEEESPPSQEAEETVTMQQPQPVGRTISVPRAPAALDSFRRPDDAQHSFPPPPPADSGSGSSSADAEAEDGVAFGYLFSACALLISLMALVVAFSVVAQARRSAAKKVGTQNERAYEPTCSPAHVLMHLHPFLPTPVHQPRVFNSYKPNPKLPHNTQAQARAFANYQLLVD